MRYVSGDTRYMKIQNPGSAFGGCMTPLKTRVSMNMSVAMVPPVSASGRAEMTRAAKVDVNM
jgi:hypothetical protein